jgi:glycosyltransferase involved in cell wall biosynthesis
MAHILILSPDILPIKGQSASGGSLRAWGLGEGLKSRGHDVQYAISKQTASRYNYSGDEIEVFEPEQLNEFLISIAPNVALFTNWPMLADLSEKPECHVVLDFHGPLLMENLFYLGPQTVQELAPRKLEFLSRADFFTCAGAKQMPYFLAWLSMAGIDLRELFIPTVLFSMSPELPKHRHYPSDVSFVYGGVLQPWQDPSLGLRSLVEELAQNSKGELKIFGGKNWLESIAARFDVLRDQLQFSDRVRFIDTLPRDALIDEYTNSSVAWDIMTRNAERELAFTSRTVEYLWCGLPVVYNNYSEISDYIRDFNAGWIIDPADELQIKATVREILQDPAKVLLKGANAQRLVRECLTWDKTIEPLDRYCRNPFRVPRISEYPLLESAVPAHWIKKKIKQKIPRQFKKQLGRLR